MKGAQWFSLQENFCGRPNFSYSDLCSIGAMSFFRVIVCLPQRTHNGRENELTFWILKMKMREKQELLSQMPKMRFHVLKVTVNRYLFCISVFFIVLTLMLMLSTIKKRSCRQNKKIECYGYLVQKSVTITLILSTSFS